MPSAPVKIKRSYFTFFVSFSLCITSTLWESNMCYKLIMSLLQRKQQFSSSTYVTRYLSSCGISTRISNLSCLWLFIIYWTIFSCGRRRKIYGVYQMSVFKKCKDNILLIVVTNVVTSSVKFPSFILLIYMIHE